MAEYKGDILLQDMQPDLFNKLEPEEAQYEAVSDQGPVWVQREVIFQSS